MFEFINVLKALATILITNSHYGKIWPISAMAMGGLLGNVIFFAVSGFCLCNIRFPFRKWYLKRISRIYPTLWIVSVLGILVGYFKINDIRSVMSLLFYPTYYHFIASIMFLYIFFYVILWIYKRWNMRLHWIIAGVFIIHLLVYLFCYDHSYYHIDVVEEPMIRFLYLEGMLMGVYFRENMQRITKKNLIGLILMVPVYFGSKILFSKIAALADFQILNQFALLLLVYYLIQMLCVSEKQLAGVLSRFKITKTVKMLSDLTLEIYMVQYLVYFIMPEMVFPINFIVVTGCILICAVLLKKVTRNNFGRGREHC